MTPLTVVCVFVQGPFPYTAEYVYRLQAMVARHLDRPYRFVCLTDRPELVPGIETITIASTLGSPESFGYWTKLRLFDPALGFEGRLLFLDLDVLVVRSLAAIVATSGPLALIDSAASREKHGLYGSDRHGRLVIRRFNSSVIVYDCGTRDGLCLDWTPSASVRLSTDQDWIGEQASDATALPETWFPRISQAQPPWPDDATVVLVKKPKNGECLRLYPWFDQAWGGAAA